MHELYGVCCGLDVHKATVVACLRRVDDQGAVTRETRTFETHTSALMELALWLVANECPIAGMESTGVYWKPVYHVLAEHVQVIVANARDCKPRNGKKTDKADASWLAELLALGFLKPSFVPPPEVVTLRDLTRSRTAFVQQRSAVRNRIHKVLEDAGIKLSCVATNVFGKSGRAMLEALIAGERDPKALAKLARGRLRAKKKQLVLALEGRVTAHHVFVLNTLLAQLNALDATIATLEARIAEAEAPFAAELRRLCTIPGVSDVAARVIIAEIGVDMSQFGSAERLASWAGLCPGKRESAGKRRSGRIRKGNRYLRAILVQCAWAARKTSSFLGRTFARLQVRLGGKKAAVAIAHKILVLAYQLLANGVDYCEERYADRNPKEVLPGLKRAVRTLRSLGFQVSLQPTTEMAAAFRIDFVEDPPMPGAAVSLPLPAT